MVKMVQINWPVSLIWDETTVEVTQFVASFSIWYDSLSDSDKPEIKAQSGAAGGVERQWLAFEHIPTEPWKIPVLIGYCNGWLYGKPWQVSRTLSW